MINSPGYSRPASNDNSTFYTSIFRHWVLQEREIPVPWKESFAVVELGLWSMLSTAAVVNTLPRRVGGQTTFSVWNIWHARFPISVERRRTRSYEMLRPRLNSLSISPLLRVSACSNMPMYSGRGVSCDGACLTSGCSCFFVPIEEVLLFCVWRFLTLLNFMSCAIDNAACVEWASAWFLMAGPCNTIFTSSRSTGGTASFWHFSLNEPVKELVFSNMYRRTICAARARCTNSLSQSSSQALSSAWPMSSSNANRTSLPLFCALRPGIWASRRSFSLVVFTLVSKWTPKCSILLLCIFARSASLNTEDVSSSMWVSSM